ncbi:MAG: DUF1846 family protein, partial [Eubacterium sp.]|nr:DUF1846 family protein [Candidatus Colimonas fimequi]
CACSDSVIAMAIQLPDGQMVDGSYVSGRETRLMVASAACVLNAIKKLAGIADEIKLISTNILENIQKLKTGILGADTATLNVEEVLTALAISAETNPTAELAMQKLPELKGCKAHCTAILSDKDENTLKALGMDVTSDPEYVTNNLYFG